MSVFFDRVLLTEDDIQKRNELKNVLETILKTGSGMDCVLHTYGSTANSLGFRNSDIDLFIELKNENNFHNKFGFEKAMSYLKKFRTTLSHNLNIMIAEPVDSRRCPIIRIDFNYLRNAFSQKAFVYKKVAIVCDLSLTNGLGVINTKLIRLYSRLESRFHQLAVVLRYWAKINGFIDGLNGLTSYALTQLVVFFCQSISPPLIPSLDQLKRLSLDTVVIDGIECRFCDDLNLIPKSKNKDSIIDLLKKFFKFYRLSIKIETIG